MADERKGQTERKDQGGFHEVHETAAPPGSCWWIKNRASLGFPPERIQGERPMAFPNPEKKQTARAFR